MTEMGIRTDRFLKYSGMQVKHRKSQLVGLNKSSNRDIMFILKKHRGFGVMDPTSIYIVKKISFLLSVLNFNLTCRFYKYLLNFAAEEIATHVKDRCARRRFVIVCSAAKGRPLMHVIQIKKCFTSE